MCTGAIQIAAHVDMADTALQIDTGGRQHNSLNDVLQFSEDDNLNELNTIPCSPYLDTDQLHDFLRSNESNFTTLSLNMQSLNAKYDALSIVINNLHIDNLHFSVIALQETWLDCNQDTNMFNLPNYKLITQGKSCSHHGGLAIYLHKDFSYSIHAQVTTSNIWEGLAIEISSKLLHRNITLLNIYKPPKDNNNNRNIEQFLAELTPNLLNMSGGNTDSIVLGDFNINLLEINQREKYSDYFELMIGNGYFPQITLPTRFSKKKRSLLDHIFIRSKFSYCNTNSAILFSAISDHLACLSAIPMSPKRKTRPKLVKLNNYREDKLQNFSNDLATTRVEYDYGNLADPNKNYDLLHDNIQRALETHMPTRLVKFNKYKHKNSAWMTGELIKSIHFRDKLYKSLEIIHPDSPDYERVKFNLQRYNAMLKRNIRLAKTSYYAKEFEKYKKDIRKTWDTLKNVLNNSSKEHVFPDTFEHNGTQYTDHTEIAERFNSYFINIGISLNESVNVLGLKPYTTYLKKVTNYSFKFESISENNIMDIINKLKCKSSTGFDNISTKLLKFIAPVITSPLCMIINQSLKTGIFPDKCKIAKVIPIYKKGKNVLFENYRPISLLPAMSKVFERVVFDQIYKYFHVNKLLYVSQYGFRKDHSTEFAATELIDRVHNYLDKGETPFALFLDLSKAFDTLDHNILLHKLENYGIHGIPLNWFESYLRNRSQYVEFRTSVSQKKIISTGVPQGSILGPLLFLIYVNDISKVSNKFISILFADDTALSSSICSFAPQRNSPAQNSSKLINQELTKITQWLAVNKLVLNITKTKFMLFSYNQKKLASVEIPEIKMNGIPISRVHQFDFLGITLDENLNWNLHISKISGKILRVLGLMTKLKRTLPQHILKMMYDSLISPHLNYGISIWGYNSGRILKLQKRAIRTICSSKYNAHTDPLFKKLSIMKIEDIFRLNCLKTYHNFLNNKVPNYIHNILKTQRTTHGHDTRLRNQPLPIVTRTVAAQKRLRAFMPKCIINTDQIVKAKLFTHSLQGFAAYFKKFYIGKYKTYCDIPNCYICN